MRVPVLVSILQQAWSHPTPSFMNHDWTRPLAIVTPVALSMNIHRASIYGTIHVAQTVEDRRLVQTVVDSTEKRRIEEIAEEDVVALRSYLSGKLSPSCRLARLGCVAFQDEGLAERALPALFERRDKDGLVPLSLMKVIGPGIFEVDGLLVFASRYFRKSFSHLNSFNDAFLSRFATEGLSHDPNARILLDGDCIGLPGTYKPSIEFDFWFGPPFSDDMALIKDGVTCHAENDAYRPYSGIDRMEFWWYEQGGLRTFECEEVRHLNAPSLGISESTFGARFVHSILDVQSGLPSHLDGAVRLYDEPLMIERQEQDILHFGRRATYIKLWRMDGAVPCEFWKSLIYDFYRDTKLVGEYFGRSDEDSVSGHTEQDDDRAELTRYLLPCDIGVHDGVAVAISFHTKTQGCTVRRIVPTELVAVDEHSRKYLEPCAHELSKMFQQQGHPVCWPQEATIVTFEDTVLNLPRIEHHSEDSCINANASLDVIQQYLETLIGTDGQRSVTLTVTVQYDDLEVWYSFAGTLSSMTVYLASPIRNLPQSLNELSSWAEQNFNYIQSTFPVVDIPQWAIPRQDGTFQVVRRMLDTSDLISITYTNSKTQLTLQNHDDLKVLVDAIRAANVKVGQVALHTNNPCSVCHEVYQNCKCKHRVDEGLASTLKPIGFFWTDKPSSPRDLEIIGPE